MCSLSPTPRNSGRHHLEGKSDKRAESSSLTCGVPVLKEPSSPNPRTVPLWVSMPSYYSSLEARVLGQAQLSGVGTTTSVLSVPRGSCDPRTQPSSLSIPKDLDPPSLLTCQSLPCLSPSVHTYQLLLECLP